MSVISFARDELKRAGWADEEAGGVIRVMEAFFKEFDSGGAVWAVAPVLQRLIACKPLSPITDEPGEWVDHGNGVYQHKRLPSVFKDPRFHSGLKACDIDAADPRAPIEFPYWPEKAEVASPVIEVE